MLEFDDSRVNFPLPVHEGKYPEGKELQALLSSYVKNARQARVSQPKANNEEKIRALIVESDSKLVTNNILRASNQLLRLTDWTQLLDAPVSEGIQKNGRFIVLHFAIYRSKKDFLLRSVGQFRLHQLKIFLGRTSPRLMVRRKICNWGLMNYLFLAVPNFCGSTLLHSLLETCPEVAVLTVPPEKKLKDLGSGFVEGNVCAPNGSYRQLYGPHSMEANMPYEKDLNYWGYRLLV